MVHAKKPEVGDKVVLNMQNGETAEGVVCAVKVPLTWEVLLDVEFNGQKYFGVGFFPYNTNEFHTDGTWNYR